MATSGPDRLSPRAREIVAAARDLLEEGGPEALSMRNIAGRLGIRASSLYKHLPNKEATELALTEAALEELGNVFEQAVGNSSDPLADLAHAYRAWALEHPHLYRLTTERPLPRDRLPAGLEQRPAALVVEACGGDANAGRAAFAFAHGMVMLELAGRFPADADLDAAWSRGIDGLRPTTRPRRGRTQR